MPKKHQVTRFFAAYKSREAAEIAQKEYESRGCKCQIEVFKSHFRLHVLNAKKAVST